MLDFQFGNESKIEIYRKVVFYILEKKINIIDIY